MGLENGGVQATMPMAPAGYGYGGGGFGGFGGDGWWIILLALVLFGGGNWGGRNNGSSDLALLAAMNNQGNVPGYSQVNDFSSLERENDIIRSDICNGISSIQASIYNGELNRSGQTQTLMGQLYGMQMADIQRGCDIQSAVNTGFGQTNYNIANQGCETRHAISDLGRSIDARLDRMEYNTLERENQALRSQNERLFFQNSQTAQNAYLTQVLRPYPQPAYIVGAPNTPVDTGAAAASTT